MTPKELAALVVPYRRIRRDPSPGTAVEEDVERIRRDEGVLCELINGVLVEKAVSEKTAFLAARLISLLDAVVSAGKLGWVLGPDAFVRLFGKQLRAPDVSFVRRDQRPGGRLLDTGYPSTAPALAVEVFSPGNTQGEIEQKRDDFFAAGTELFWIVYPDRQGIEVSTGPRDHRIFGRDDLLDGGTVLPGFSIKVADLFTNIDLGDPDATP
jgi:Uma2 family endonuclease